MEFFGPKRRGARRDGCVRMLDFVFINLILSCCSSSACFWLPSLGIGMHRAPWLHMFIHPNQTNFLQMEIRDPRSGQNPPAAYGDVILGNGAREVALNFIPSPSPNVTSYHVILDETHVVSEPPVSPLEFQSILAELMSLKIRATYYPFPQGSVTFKEVALETGAHAQGAPGEVSVGFVENATCHVNYTGLSCEQCAQGTGINMQLLIPNLSQNNREEKSLGHVAMVAKFLDLNKPWSSISVKKKTKKLICMTFMITVRNKTITHTFLQSLDNANGRLCQEK